MLSILVVGSLCNVKLSRRAFSSMQEATEKADEIDAKAEEEFNIEKASASNFLLSPSPHFN